MPPEDPSEPSNPADDDLGAARQMLQTAKLLGLAVLVLAGGMIAYIGPGELAEGAEVGGVRVRVGDVRGEHGHQDAIRFTSSGTQRGKLDTRGAGQKVARTLVGGAFQGLGEQFLTLIAVITLFVGGYFGLKS